MTGQSYYDVQKLLCKVSRACAPKMQTVSMLVLILFSIQYLGKSSMLSLMFLPGRFVMPQFDCTMK